MNKNIRTLTLLLLLLAAPAAIAGCAAALPAIASASAVVSEALAILSGINTVVSEYFGRHPDVPASTRDEYVRIHDTVIAALTNYQKVAEATNDLNSGDAMAAFAKFREAYDALMNWLATNGLRNGEGKLMLEGQVISELPPAAAFKR
jgi:hypothetical protein